MVKALNSQFTSRAGYFIENMKSRIKTLMKTPIETSSNKVFRKNLNHYFATTWEEVGETQKLLGRSASTVSGEFKT